MGSASRALRSLGSGLELTVAGASPFAPRSATSLRFSWSRWRSRLSWCKSIDAPCLAALPTTCQAVLGGGDVVGITGRRLRGGLDAKPLSSATRILVPRGSRRLSPDRS